MPKIEVRIPRGLAEAAVAAWSRDDDGSGATSGETYELREARHRAGVLALIGLSITERGQWEHDEVVVKLDPVLLGVAIDAADDLADDAPTWAHSALPESGKSVTTTGRAPGHLIAGAEVDAAGLLNADLRLFKAARGEMVGKSSADLSPFDRLSADRNDPQPSRADDTEAPHLQVNPAN